MSVLHLQVSLIAFPVKENVIRVLVQVQLRRHSTSVQLVFCSMCRNMLDLYWSKTYYTEDSVFIPCPASGAVALAFHLRKAGVLSNK